MKKIKTVVFACRRKACSIGMVVFFAGFLLGYSGWAQGILRFQATDLTDTTPGEDLWEYSYTLEGFTFAANQGFSVYFDPLLYTQLQNPRPLFHPAWNVLAVQPDVVLLQPGYFDALALMDLPPMDMLFQIAFVWQGLGVPQMQAFNQYDSNFSSLGEGTTAVPEPATWMLLSWGGVTCLGLKRRWFHSK